MRRVARMRHDIDTLRQSLDFDDRRGKYLFMNIHDKLGPLKAQHIEAKIESIQPSRMGTGDTNDGLKSYSKNNPYSRQGPFSPSSFKFNETTAGVTYPSTHMNEYSRNACELPDTNHQT